MNKFQEKAQQTKDNITEVFWALVREKSISKIRIHDITERVGVNRGTFYLHYKDIFDLLEQEEDVLIDQWKQGTIYLQEVQNLSDMAEGIKNFYLQCGDKPFLLLQDPVNSSFERKMKKINKDNIMNIRGIQQSEEFDYAYEFIISGVIHTLIKWHRDGRQVDIDIVLARMMKFIESGMTSSIR